MSGHRYSVQNKTKRVKDDRIQQKLLYIALTLAIHKYIFVQDSLILAKTQFQDIFTSPYLLPSFTTC